MALELLFDPDAFFEQESRSGTLKGSVSVVSLTGLANISGTMFILPVIMEQLPEHIGVFVLFGVGLGLIFGAFSIFLLWIAVSGIFYLLSEFYGGRGTFRRTIILLGWGFLPLVFSGISTGLLTYYAVQGVTLPADPNEMELALEGLGAAVANPITYVLDIVFLLWSGFLWMFGIKHARDISLREAVLTVGPMIVAAVAWNLFQLL